jgi:AraC family transcriptional regulator
MIPTQAFGQGACRLSFADIGGFLLDVTRYPPGFELAPHQHDRANLCVVLEGALTERMRRVERDCCAATLIVKPRGEVHSDRFHADGACCLNLALDPEQLARMHGGFPALGEVQFEVDPALGTSARRIALELSRWDDLSPLVVEGLALELVARTLRSRRGRVSGPHWLERAREFLHATYTGHVSLAAVAHAVDRHPVSVAQQFRRRFGVSVGEYVRRLRVDHVARRLLAGRASTAMLAVEAGFADQSHMQRVFKAAFGVTPAAYRQSRGRG